MNYTSLVMKTTIKNNLRWRIAAAIIFGIILICVVGIAAIFIIQFLHPETKEAVPDKAVISNALGLILFSTSFCSLGIYSSVFAAQSLIREKTRGNIQALLATPVTPGNICIGKTFGTFLPGFLFSLVMMVVVYLLINVIYLVPVTGFMINPWMVISSVIGIPSIFFFLVLLINLIGLTGKTMTANIIGQLPLSILPALMINLAVRNVASADSWLFAVILFGLAGIAAVAGHLIRKKLTTENVILSI